VDEVFVRVLLNRFVKTVSPQNEENAMYRDVPVIVGDGESRLNAFYTVLHSLYLDGRWLAVFLGPFCFGVALGYWYLAFLRTGQEYALVWLQFLSYIGFFSLFQSPCEEARTFTAILFVFLLSRFSLPARDIVLRRLNGARYNDRGG
jgi:hypothetical protein